MDMAEVPAAVARTVSRTLFRRAIVGWCIESRVYDEPYRGPGHNCPIGDCYLEKGRYSHNMHKRVVWICRVCNCCTLSASAPGSTPPKMCHCMTDDEFDDFDIYCYVDEAGRKVAELVRKMLNGEEETDAEE